MGRIATAFAVMLTAFGVIAAPVAAADIDIQPVGSVPIVITAKNRRTESGVVNTHSYRFNRGPGAYEMLLYHDRALRGLPALPKRYAMSSWCFAMPSATR